jgi:AcrR family transcriptional regulator
MVMSQYKKTNSNINKGVRDRLLDSAEELFCEHGFDDTSVRDLATAAGCNIASVNYYFGSKENLYVEMFRRYMSRLLDEHIENIRKAMNSEQPTLEQLIRMMVVLALRSLDSDSGERPMLKMMVREVLNPHLKAAIGIDELVGKFFTELHNAIIKLCPGLKSEAGLLCIYSLDGIILHALLFSEHYAELYPELTTNELIEHIVRFSKAGIRAYAEGKTE